MCIQLQLLPGYLQTLCCPVVLNIQILQEAEQMLAGVGEMGADTLHAALTKFGVVAPDTKNPISSPFPFNLMFKTSIGPRGDLVGYLRPETAQVNGRKVWPQCCWLSSRLVLFLIVFECSDCSLTGLALVINLMFKTSIGPRGDLVGYLRLETAQVRQDVDVDCCWLSSGMM
jgi:hypothetical protein